MSIMLYHQVGHNANWNRESLEGDGCGDGLILSPVHQSVESIEKLPLSVRTRSLFDPQYYLPNSQKAKLNSYDFFPENLAGGFSTLGFGGIARESAKRCVEFQIEHEFDGIVIPARHFAEMNPDYTTNQASYTVEPFLRAISEARTNKQIWLTLPLTSAMIQHSGYRTDILNWVTSYPEINGVYVIIECARETKQIQSLDVLKAQLMFLTELQQADLEVIAGHCNTESLLFSLIEGCRFTVGSFENTRMFSIDKFVSSLEERRGPRARIYLSGLLNWIQFAQARMISQEAPDLWKMAYVENNYGNQALGSPTEPFFNQPTLYKHYFLCFEAQVRELAVHTLSKRYELLRSWISEAIQLDEELQRRHFDLERHGCGKHLQPWLDVINWYYRRFLV